ncbi:MAG: hypothetical protein NZP74_01020 [Anaerolineales bacterium]|nr:hypothetical protein [Anaerolineales bacterium]MDW8278199.1 hypothetical protein [Anaerolineales bacterium]
MLKTRSLYLGETLLPPPSGEVSGEYVTLLGESWYKIAHYDALPPFLMSIVSSGNHWLFVSSNGGLSAGRAHADRALFPYYTEDKLTDNHENTGPKTVLRFTRGTQTWLWEPFSIRQQGVYRIERHLYKNIPGTAILFEEMNHSLKAVFRYAWRTSNRLGFVKTAWLMNLDLQMDCQVELLDGLQNLMPAHADSAVQNQYSCLLDAYKRAELDISTGLGIFTLNSRLTDLAEPSESLRATSVFQVGLTPVGFLLSSRQLDAFRFGADLQPESEVRGQRGAYFVHAQLSLDAGQERCWHLVADVHQDHAALVELRRFLQTPLAQQQQVIEQEIAFNTFSLQNIVSAADGLQVSQSQTATARHFANVLFNVMRGGIFADQYWIDRADLFDFLETHQRGITQQHRELLAPLPARFRLDELYTCAQSAPPALRRLLLTYLPLTFSRRHGDPSRPWNRFSINLQNPDGSRRLDYEGNWRDIFQNWEALAYSYPDYLEAMIGVFLSATTADGYNPYRITRAGVDWEVPEEGNPWANIGYWSDHQIIYLQKLMEASARLHPGALRRLLRQPLWSYANVPYRIKPYEDLLHDPYDTIVFDHALHARLEQESKTQGSDARLLRSADGTLVLASLTEKLFTLLLAKLVNFVPEGGIWMNTQRPEWNDANNALVGRGLSVVTLAYLRRFLVFFQNLLQEESEPFLLRTEIADWLRTLAAILEQFRASLEQGFSPAARRAMMDALGQAGSAYRWRVYQAGFSESFASLQAEELRAFLSLAREYVEHSLRANRRPDALYHSYNLLRLTETEAYIDRLQEMLEGQVAILSSELLSSRESLELLYSLRKSALYRPDQHTYLLYPDKALPGFLEKNLLSPEQLKDLRLPFLLSERGETSLFVRDAEGNFHFNGDLRNARDVRRVLQLLQAHSEFADLAKAEAEAILEQFERVFRHAEFTGRSGSFFAYEGLGSVYWHMVAKLLLAVQETTQRFAYHSDGIELRAIYYEIRAGLGYHKSPAEYGAFPTDPYSHTPRHQGARQPGMTGSVKEEILTRRAETGILFVNGKLAFHPFLLSADELLTQPHRVSYLDVNGEEQTLNVPAGSLACFVCQTPILLQFGLRDEVTLYFADETTRTLPGRVLDLDYSRRLFARDGSIRQVRVTFANGGRKECLLL